MKENRYDDPLFFDKYGQMTRSREGLSGAGPGLRLWLALQIRRRPRRRLRFGHRPVPEDAGRRPGKESSSRH